MESELVNWGQSGSRIIMIHGSLSVGVDAFSEQQALSERFRLEVVIRPGYGPTPSTEAVDIARDAAEIVELLGDGAHLVGTSMGGMVAMRAAGMRPDLVHSLTVIEPPAFPLAFDCPDVKRVSKSLKAHWQVADASDHHSFVTGFLRALEIDQQFPDPLPPSLAIAVRNLVTERPWKIDVPLGAVADGDFPKLVVTGGWSGAFDAIAARLAGLFDTELHFVKGAGHGAQKVKEHFNRLLIDHISTSEGEKR